MDGLEELTLDEMINLAKRVKRWEFKKPNPKAIYTELVGYIDKFKILFLNDYNQGEMYEIKIFEKDTDNKLKFSDPLLKEDEQNHRKLENLYTEIINKVIQQQKNSIKEIREILSK